MVVAPVQVSHIRRLLSGLNRALYRIPKILWADYLSGSIKSMGVSGGKSRSDPTNLTHSTPLHTLQGLVVGGLASGASSASGEME